jgi:hypothetical protein
MELLSFMTYCCRSGALEIWEFEKLLASKKETIANPLLKAELKLRLFETQGVRVMKYPSTRLVKVI